MALPLSAAREPESVHYRLCPGPDAEDARILGTVIGGVPIVNTYVPQGYRVGAEKYVSKLKSFTEYADTLGSDSIRICPPFGSVI